MIIKKKQNISTVFFINLILIATLSCLLTGFFWIKNEKNNFYIRSSNLKSEYLENQNSLLKKTIEDAVNYIEYKKRLTGQRLKEDIKRRVFEAYGIVENIYEKQSEKLSDKEIVLLIKQALRPVRFFDNRSGSYR